MRSVDPTPPRKRAQQPTPTFRPTLLWHGCPSQQLLSSHSVKVFHGVTNHCGDIFIVLNPTTTRNVYVLLFHCLAGKISLLHNPLQSSTASSFININYGHHFICPQIRIIFSRLLSMVYNNVPNSVLIILLSKALCLMKENMTC